MLKFAAKRKIKIKLTGAGAPFLRPLSRRTPSRKSCPVSSRWPLRPGPCLVTILSGGWGKLAQRQRAQSWESPCA